MGVGGQGSCWAGGPIHSANQCPIPTGLLPDAKKPRLLHGTLIMKDSVSAAVAMGLGGCLCRL